MRSKAPNLILQGDTRRAKPWIPWAQRWLKRLKNTLGDIPINQSNWVVGGDRAVFIQIQSVIDIDRIRIFVKQPKEEGCLDSAVFTITTSGLTGFFTPDENLCRAGTFWSFGDNQYKKGTLGQGTISHTYERPGTYNVKLISYAISTASPVPELTVTSNIAASTVKDAASSLVSWAACYADYTTKTFYSSNSTGSGYYGTSVLIFNNMYEFKEAFLIPLSAWAGNPVIASGKVITYITGRYTSYTAYDDDGGSKPVSEPISGSDLGITAFESPIEPVGLTIASLIDHTQPLVDSIVTFQDQSATDPAAILPDAAAHSSNTSGWQSRRVDISASLRRVTAIQYESKKELTKPVTVA
jgi:hypothetical protein